MNIDVDLLRKQRDLVLSLVEVRSIILDNKEESDLLEGLVNLLDALLDAEEGVSYETGETS